MLVYFCFPMPEIFSTSQWTVWGRGVCIMKLLWLHHQGVHPLLMEEVFCRELQESVPRMTSARIWIPPATHTPRKLKLFFAAWFQCTHRARVGSFSYKHSLAGCTHKWKMIWVLWVGPWRSGGEARRRGKSAREPAPELSSIGSWQEFGAHSGVAHVFVDS